MSSAYDDSDSEIEMSASARQNSKKRMWAIFEDEDAELIYENHSHWGIRGKYPLWTTSTYPKTLTLFRTKIRNQLLPEYDRILATLSKAQKEHLEETIKGWSDDQFSLWTEKVEWIDTRWFDHSIRILAGEHAYLKAMKYPSDKTPPKTTPKEKHDMDTGPEESSEDWKTLQSRVHALPPELFQMVKSWTLDGAFLADIEVDLSQPLDACKDTRASLNISALGLIDKASHQAYHDRVWAQNLWIIPAGRITTNNVDDISLYFKQIPRHVRSKISRLKVSFSAQDFYEPRNPELEGYYNK